MGKSAKETGLTLLNIEDEINDVRLLIEVMHMAASDLAPEQSGPMAALLDTIGTMLTNARDGLTAYRDRAGMIAPLPKRKEG